MQCLIPIDCKIFEDLQSNRGMLTVVGKKGGAYEENPEDLENLEIPGTEDIQKQIEDALNELPDEYKDLLGGLGDLGGMLGSLLD